MVECYAIKLSDIPGCYFSHAYNWDGGLHRALFYKTRKAAVAMAESKGKPYRIVKIQIKEMEETDG